MFDEANFCNLVESGSLHDLFKMIYAAPREARLLDLALMRLVKNQEGCMELEVKVYELLRHRAQVDVCDLDDEKTPLHYAASNGNSSLIDLLLHYGASIKPIDTNGNTVLHSVARAADPLSLSLLLVKVYEDAPEVLEIRNQQKKKFNELFRTRQQVLLFNRFKELKGMKTGSRAPPKDEKLLKCGRSLIASMVIGDRKTIKKPVLTLQDDAIPLSLSLSAATNKKKKKKTASSIEYEYLKRYGNLTHLDPIIEPSTDFSQIGNLVEQLSKGNPFNLFNYACTVLTKESVVQMIDTMQPRLKRGDFRRATIDPVDTLKMFHPDLVESFLKQLEQEEICAICKEADGVRGQKWSTLCCKHQFHTCCIKEWFQMSWERTCPMCRRVIYTEIK